MKLLDTKSPDFLENFKKLIKKNKPIPEEVFKKVKKIFRDIEEKGDIKLKEYVERFDLAGGKLKTLKVPEEKIKKAKLDNQELSAIKLAIKRIEKFHRNEKIYPFKINEDGGTVEQRIVGLDRLGVYIPAGRAPLVSTVLMTVIPARIAKVKEIVLVSPPSGNGEIHNKILAVANIFGLKEIYRMGGAHAVAGLAIGTESIKKVDKIVGPGSIWVQSAKLYAFVKGFCGIDTLAGPSEVVIISDGSVSSRLAIADLFAQLEHGEDSIAILLSHNHAYLREVKTLIEGGSYISKETRKNLFLVKTKNLNESFDLSNLIAPEHLELHIKKPKKHIDKIKNAGAIFLGAYSPVAIGDYIAGPNHCLPTSSCSRFSSGLSVFDFLKRQSIVNLSKNVLIKIGKQAEIMGNLEGLSLHSESISIRIK